ncbi:MAG: DUF1847 domain-containing protein [Clostridium sp.]|uniref:DUF1847 domain-containing protein n=1 Tax=Clostridium sp. TaxID=1506 RepID=UPI002A8DBC70|nr:DUF1847 domain-containing protein [Clostridium sp.]MDY5099496.1 DUF1847 domain-containing protein [Clostridium sp.]
MYTCDSCKQNNCKNGDIENAPLNCPCRLEKEQNNIKEYYKDEETLNIAHNSALVESEGYCQKTRVEEIIDFAHKCGYKKIGVAFCIGLIKEAQTFCSILRHHGFEVESIVCKNGSIPKSFINITDAEQVRPGTYEPMCNPIGQAILLNEAHTDLNILLGLCVGHDSLFIKHSDAPITVFAVKDRVLCHNPLAAIYGADKYYKAKLFGGNR